MRKILFATLFIAAAAIAHSQNFVQASFGYIPTASFWKEGEVGTSAWSAFKKGKSFDFQIGGFVEENKMRTLALTYDFGFKERDTKFPLYQDPNTGNYTYTTRILSRSAITVGYERKKTMFHTEFNDPWNIYNIIDYRLTYEKINDHLEVAPLDKVYQAGILERKPISGSSIDFELGFGYGFARKVSPKTYLFADIKCVFVVPFFETAPFISYPLSLGVRRLL